MTKNKDVYSYYTQALDTLDPNHPHYDEIRDLLEQQIEDELTSYAPAYYGSD